MKKFSNSIDVIVGLLLFCLFTVSMLFVILTGAQAYRGINLAMQMGYCERTCIDYITAKIRHYDVSGMVNVVDFEGTNALELDEDIGGDLYSTLIYYYDGYVYELFAAKDAGLKPEDGFSIIKVDSLTFEKISDSLVEISCFVDSRSETMHVSLRSEGSGGGS